MNTTIVPPLAGRDYPYLNYNYLNDKPISIIIRHFYFYWKM